jgi:hypothetical protein
MNELEITAVVFLGIFIIGAIWTLIRTRRLHSNEDIYLLSNI